MGEFVKAVRWSAPGSVLIFSAAVVLTTSHMIIGLGWPGSEVNIRAYQVSSGAAALIVFGSVPAGFLVYQIYYFAYSAPHGMVLSFVHLDVALKIRGRGTAVSDLHAMREWRAAYVNGVYLRWPVRWKVPGTDRSQTLWLFRVGEGATSEAAQPRKHLQEPLDLSSDQAKEVLRRYAAVREQNWLKLEAQLAERLRERGDADRDFGNTERLADIFHTLGASKTAVWLGWLVGVVLAAWPPNKGYDSAAGHALFVIALSLMPASVATLWLYKALHLNRAHCQARRIALIQSVMQPSTKPD